MDEPLVFIPSSTRSPLASPLCKDHGSSKAKQGKNGEVGMLAMLASSCLRTGCFGIGHKWFEPGTGRNAQQRWHLPLVHQHHLHLLIWTFRTIVNEEKRSHTKQTKPPSSLPSLGRVLHSRCLSECPWTLLPAKSEQQVSSEGKYFYSIA